MTDNEPRKPPFRFTDEQRREIISALQPKGAGVSSGLGKANAETLVDEIEQIVSIARRAIIFREDHPIPDWLHDKFRGLYKPIGEILSVLENPASKHLHEFFPNLCRDLGVLNEMVQTDQRIGRGRPPTPGKDLKIWLIVSLAEVWGASRGWPTRWYRDDKGRDWGPFYRFFYACVDPPEIEVSDYFIREVIEAGPEVP